METLSLKGENLYALAYVSTHGCRSLTTLLVKHYNDLLDRGLPQLFVWDNKTGIFIVLFNYRGPTIKVQLFVVMGIAIGHVLDGEYMKYMIYKVCTGWGTGTVPYRGGQFRFPTLYVVYIWFLKTFLYRNCIGIHLDSHSLYWGRQ